MKIIFHMLFVCLLCGFASKSTAIQPEVWLMGIFCSSKEVGADIARALKEGRKFKARVFYNIHRGRAGLLSRGELTENQREWWESLGYSQDQIRSFARNNERQMRNSKSWCQWGGVIYVHSPKLQEAGNVIELKQPMTLPGFEKVPRFHITGTEDFIDPEILAELSELLQELSEIK